MGQLRTSIQNLQKLIVNNPTKLEALQKALEPGDARVDELGRTAQEGWEALFVYLTAKFKKAGSTAAANAGKKLSEVMDAEVGTLVKGIDQWRREMHAVASKYGAVFDAGRKAIEADLALVAAETKKLRAVADKKKAKWLVSPKYKAKIKGYLAVIDDIEAAVQSQAQELAASGKVTFDAAWIDKWFAIKADMTVQDIQNHASMGLQGIMKTYLANQQVADGYVRKWRDEYKGMAGQLATMKKWSEDADAMEAEA